MKKIRTDTEATIIITHEHDGSGSPIAIAGYGSDEAAQALVEFMKLTAPGKNIITVRIPIMFDEPMKENGS